MKAKVVVVSLVLISLALVYAVKGTIRLVRVMLGQQVSA
jgi:hypothetical protein